MENHITHTKISFFALLLIASACVFAEVDPIIEDMDNTIEFRQMLGQMLSLQDWAAATGTDAMLEQGANLENEKLIEFIVENHVTSWTLSYLGKRGFSQGVYYQIEVNHDGPVVSTFRNLSENPEKLTDNQKALFKATTLAKKQSYLLCSFTYNTAVLPITLDETKYLYTYLLAASNKKDDRVLGGHHRFIISANGKKIIQHKPHTNSCLNGVHQENMAAQVLTHLNDKTPNEIHIYMSHLYDLPIYIWTDEQSMWHVYSGEIRSVDLDQKK